MDLLTIITLLIVVSTAFAYINVRFLKFPTTIGLMILAIVFSVIMILVNYAYPDVFSFAERVVEQINFSRVLLDVMLSFLLFAGALHTNGSLLKVESRNIMMFSVIGVAISTFLIATLLYYAIQLAGYHLDYIYCLLFGSLISPTDPIAVLGILTKANVPKKVEINIVGESLFNDGVGVVIFTIILQIIRLGVDKISVAEVAVLFAQEALGGILFGLLLGYATFRLLRSIDNYETEVMITIAVVMGGYYLASMLHVSGPLAIVVAGLFTGNKAREEAMSKTTETYIFKFWELIDVIMNAILFVLIGLRMMVLDFSYTALVISLIAIPVILFSRYVAITIPAALLGKRSGIERKHVLLLVWGGLRGGLSIAMALALSREEAKDLIVFITYIVVLFSILVQGLTVGRLANKLFR
jgi:CPA1 family monovalent cation:H+ antiporter